MLIDENLKYKSLMLDRSLQRLMQSDLMNIQDKINQIQSGKIDESELFVSWLKSLIDNTDKSRIRSNNKEIEAYGMFVKSNINREYFHYADSQLYQVMYSELNEYNGEKVLCEFNSDKLTFETIEDTNPRYILTNCGVYFVEMIPITNLFGKLKRIDLFQKNSLKLDDVNLNDEFYTDLFFHFLRVYSHVEDATYITEFDIINEYKKESIEDFLPFISDDDLKTFIKVDMELENMISSYNNDLANVRNVNFDGVGFKIPLKINAFLPGLGWKRNTPFLNLVNSFTTKVLIISYCVCVRNLYLFSILNNNNSSKYRYLLLLEQHGLLDSYFQKQTYDMIAKNSKKVIDELSSINESVNDLGEKFSALDGIGNKLTNIDNSLQFNTLLNAYMAYKMSK